jgi:hypothetical protein
MAAATTTKKEEAYPLKASSSRWQITNLKQSILETFDIYQAHISFKNNLLKSMYKSSGKVQIISKMTFHRFLWQ